MTFASFSTGKRKAPTLFTAWKPRRKRYACRCLACDLRVTLAKHPDEYLRGPPKCKRCKSALRVDRWRIANEWGVKPCRCYGYSFPHARARGFCEHNPALTAEDLEAREAAGSWA